MKKSARSTRASKSGRSRKKTAVKDLKPRSGVKGGISIVKYVDKTSPR